MGSATENRKINIYINGKQVENNMKSIRGAYFKANAQLNKMTIGSKDYINQMKKVDAIKAHMNRHNKSLYGASRAWQQLKSVMVGVLGANLIEGGLQRLISFIPDLVNRVTDLSDIFSDVQKKSGLTKTEVRELNNEFKNFNTRTARKELLGLAVVGGSLGKETIRDLKNFVKVGDQIGVALGDDLGGDKNAAIKTVGKLTETYKIGQQYQVEFEEGMLKIGSALNEISASGSSEASFLIDYTSRLNGLSNQAGITAASQIGFAAVFDESNQRVETSSTAMNQVISGMFSDTQTYADVAGLSLKDFTELMHKDANEALLRFLEGLNGNNEQFDVFVDKLKAVGIDGARAKSVLATVAAQTDKVREKQALANKAMEEGTSLTQEFNLKNENAAGKLEKLQKRLSAIFVSSPIMNRVEGLIGRLYDLVNIPLSDKLEKERISMKGLEVQIYDTNTPAEKRIALIEKLKLDYPKYLQFINAETISNTDLKVALSAVNDNLVQKILLQRKQEDVNKTAENAAAKEQRKYEAQIAYQELVGKLAEKYGHQLSTNLTLHEQSRSLVQSIKASDTTFSLFENEDITALKEASSKLLVYKKTAEDANIAHVDMVKNKAELVKLLEEEAASIKITNKAFLEAHGVGDDPDDPETENRKTKSLDSLKKEAEERLAEFEKHKKKWNAVKKHLGFEEYDDSEANETEQEVFILNPTTESKSDPVFEAEMEKLAKRELAKAELIAKIEEETGERRHLTKAQFQKVYHLELLAQAQEEGISLQELYKQLEEDEDGIRREKLSKRIAEFEEYYATAKVVSNAYFEWQKAKSNEQLARNRKDTDDKIKQVQDQVSNDVFTQEQADAQIAIIKERARVREARIKTEQWKKQRASNMLEILAETAIAIAKANALGPPLSIPAMIQAGIVGGTQLAVIAAQEVPQFAFGTNYTPNSDIIVGEFGPERLRVPEGSQITSATETADILSDAANPQLNLGGEGGFGGDAETKALLLSIDNRLAKMPSLVRGDWRLDELDAILDKRSRSERAGTLGG